MKAFRAAHLFDGAQFRQGGGTVVVEDGAILGVESRLFEPPDGCEVVDWGEATMLPGLIDTHTHLVGDGGVGALEQLPTRSDDELDAVITDSLHKHLAAGETTVRDLGDRSFNVAERRRPARGASRAGTVRAPEPTILAAGPPITSVGGHCHYLNGEVADRSGIAAAVAERAERNVDVVKVMASGGFVTPGTDVLSPQFTGEELWFLVEESHRQGLPVTAHAHALSAVRQAIDAGVDGIEHCSCMTRTTLGAPLDVAEQLAASGIAVCLTAGSDLSRLPELPEPPPFLVAMLANYGLTLETLAEQQMGDMRRMYDAGVTLLAGVDSGVTPLKDHGIVALSVGQHAAAGLPVATALAGATSLAAAACGIGDRKGMLAPGWDADLLAVAGEVRSDVAALRSVLSVVLAGEVVSASEPA